MDNKRKKSKREQGRAAGNTKRKKSIGEQEDRAAAGIIRERRVKGNKAEQQATQTERRVKWNKKKSSSRDNKRKKSKVEQEDRAAAGIIRERDQAGPAF